MLRIKFNNHKELSYMKTYLIGAVMLISTLGFTQNATIRGRITSDNQAVEAVSILLEARGHKKWTVSDRNGNYGLNLPAGEYRFKVQGLGYIPYNDKVNIAENDTLVKDISLKEDVLGIDEVVVTATKTKETRKNAPVLVTVTTNKELAKVRAHTLMEGLVFQPGLRPEVNCQNCGFSQVRINGLEGAYSQILIDSRPIFGSLNGVYGLEQIPSNMIDRIEVTRGGGSALFGSNAIAGTINVITKEPTANEAQAGVTASLIGGEAADYISSFNGSLVNENYMRGLSFHAMSRQRQAYDANGDGFSEITRLKNVNAGGKFFNDFTDRKKLTAELNVSNENRRGGDQLDRPEHTVGVAESIRTDMIGGNATYDYFTPSYNNKFSVYASGQYTRADNFYGGLLYEQKDVIDPNTGLPKVDDDGNKITEDDLTKPDYYASSLLYGVTKEKTVLAGGQHTGYFPIGEGNLQWTSGTEYQYDKINEKRENPDILAVNQHSNSFGLFTQADWRLSPKFKFLVGLRLDNVKYHIEGQGTEPSVNNTITALNPRASVLWNIADSFIARGSYARGFRAPFFFAEDVHAELNTGEVRKVKLADNLKKETSDSFTASFEYNHAHDDHQIVAMIEGFYTALHDRFTYEDAGEENGLAIRQKVNSDGAVVKGVNVEFKYSPNRKYIMQLGATVQSAKYNSVQTPEPNVTSDAILRTPDVYGNLIATYKPLENWDINLVTVYTGPMKLIHKNEDEALNALVKSKGFFDFGLNTTYEITSNKFFKTELSVGVKNLFNQYQNDFDTGKTRDSDYIYGPALPRTVFAGIKIKI